MAILTSEDLALRRKAYSLLKFSTPRVISSLSESMQFTRYPVSGDSLYINKINGNGVIQVKLGNRNPWINVFEGMTIHREFDAVYIRDVHLYVLYDPTTEVEAYSSWGPMISRIPKTHGSKGPPVGLNGFSATTTTRALSDYLIVGAASIETPGAFEGGYIIIQNTDPANTLYYGVWRHGDAAVPASAGNVVLPGSSVSLEVGGKLGPYTCPVAAANLVIDLCFWTHAGACSFALTLSARRRDSTDILYVGSAANPSKTLED